MLSVVERIWRRWAADVGPRGVEKVVICSGAVVVVLLARCQSNHSRLCFQSFPCPRPLAASAFGSGLRCWHACCDNGVWRPSSPIMEASIQTLMTPCFHPDHNQVAIEQSSPMVPYGSGLLHDFRLRKDKDG